MSTNTSINGLHSGMQYLGSFWYERWMRKYMCLCASLHYLMNFIVICSLYTSSPMGNEWLYCNEMKIFVSYCRYFRYLWMKINSCLYLKRLKRRQYFLHILLWSILYFWKRNIIACDSPPQFTICLSWKITIQQCPVHCNYRYQCNPWPTWTQEVNQIHGIVYEHVPFLLPI